MNKWLDSNTYSPFIKHYKSYTDNITNYYEASDSEIKSQNPEYNEYAEDTTTQYYDDLKNRKDKIVAINIPYATKRYEADTIFRQLIDFHIKLNIDEQYAITPSMRNSFYEFLKNYS